MLIFQADNSVAKVRANLQFPLNIWANVIRESIKNKYVNIWI